MTNETSTAQTNTPTVYDAARNRVETWMGGRLVTLDLQELWAEQFAFWDMRVDSRTASRIASAIDAILWDATAPDDPDLAAH